MKENYNVTKSNDLIQAKYQHHLTAREQKLILTMISMIQPDDNDFKEYEMSLKEFSELLGLKDTKYTELSRIIKILQSKLVEVPNAEKGGYFSTSWVAGVNVLPNSGVVGLSVHPRLKPFLLQLQTQYTTYKLIHILDLNGAYSIRFYELFRQWVKLSEWECKVDLLREKTGSLKKSYETYSNFKNKVLMPAIDEINEKTDLYVTFEEKKKGRKVDSIKFNIRFRKSSKSQKKKKGNVVSHFKYPTKIIREELVPDFLNEGNTNLDSIYEKLSKEEIDIMRKQLIEEMKN